MAARSSGAKRTLTSPTRRRRELPERRGHRQPMAVPREGKRAPGSWRSGMRKLLYVFPAAAVLGLIWGAFTLPRLFAASPEFRLQALEVKGLRLLHGQDILAASGLSETQNLFLVDLPQVAESVEALPWVRKVYLERRPPDRLRIQVEERRRLAWIRLDALYGIDEDGVLLPAEKVEGETRADLDLPLLTAFEGIEGRHRPGDHVATPALQQALDWWRQARQEDPEFCLNISEIQPLSGGSVRLVLVGDGLDVRVPVDRVGERLTVLKEMMQRIYKEFPEPAYLDLRFAGQAVVGGKAAQQSSEKGGEHGAG
ncbi:MAG: FtsQ-type POTRA domain-containing protein [Candidatus Latescibacteria bacterium]|nr:FtsQ-type POTRA domain-containing protein [Candidatus Latescibacterota bacterium]